MLTVRLAQLSGEEKKAKKKAKKAEKKVQEEAKKGSFFSSVSLGVCS